MHRPRLSDLMEQVTVPSQYSLQPEEKKIIKVSSHATYKDVKITFFCLHLVDKTQPAELAGKVWFGPTLDQHT